MALREKDSFKIVVWGIGKQLNDVIEEIKSDERIVFIDKQCDGEGQSFCGHPLYSPSKIAEINYGLVVIGSTKFFYEISHELIYRYGVSVSNIVSLPFFLYSKNKYRDSYILLLQQKVWLRETLLQGESSVHTARIYSVPGTKPKFEAFDEQEILDQDKEVLNISGCFLPARTNETVTMFVVTHKEYPIVRLYGYRAIFAGAIRNRNHPYDGDESGDNISELNAIINECTAMYWIWKNYNSEYVGIAHYRRYLVSPVNKGWPIQTTEIKDLLQKSDFIVADAYSEGSTLIEAMRRVLCEEAFTTSWAVLEEIFSDRDNSEKEAFYQVMNGRVFFMCNLFITRKNFYDDYCEWLFQIIFVMIDRIDIKDEWDSYSKRVIGFWAERLFTVWLVLTNHTIKELPIHLTDDGKPYGK